MEKTIEISGKAYSLNNSFGVLIEYLEQFGTDYFDDIRKIEILSRSARTGIINTAIVEMGKKLIWAMIKSAEYKPVEYKIIDSLPQKELSDLIVIADNMMSKSFPDSNSESAEDENNPITTEGIMSCCRACGINDDAIRRYTLRLLIKSVEKYVELHSPNTKKENSQVRQATQEDFDRW